jgi:membrane protease YdiL (CAAX protease family)
MLSAMLSGIYSYKKFNDTLVKYFIWFLVYVLLIEILSGYYNMFSVFNLEHLIKDSMIRQNYWWITLTWVIGAPLFYAYYFRSLLHHNLLKRILRAAFWLVLVVFGIVLFFDYRIIFSSYAMPIEIISFFVVITSVVCYFIETLSSKKIELFYKSINFYIATIVLFWWLTTTPLLFFEEYFNTRDAEYITLKWMVYLLANVFMYGGFAISLYFCKPQKNEYIE